MLNYNSEWIRERGLYLNCEKPLKECCDCGAELFYGDDCFNFDGDTFCEECFDDMMKSFKHTLSDEDIPEPDWDAMDGGHDDY